MQPNYSFDDITERRGQLNVGSVRDEGLVLIAVRVHLRGEGVLYLRDVAAENDKTVAL